jgi:hypothetical protein
MKKRGPTCSLINCWPPPAVRARVVKRTFSDGRTDGRTMAAGASVTWTHCSVIFEVTWNKIVRVRTDEKTRLRRRISLPSPLPPSPLLSARTLGCVYANAKK